MGLQINTNVNALNAYRNLTGTQSSMTTSLERLSSGLRINRAADDAAGLAISEKLRSQVNGLNQAQANAQDGVSLIQTAEGALNETHAILQRMRTLAVQAANDTNTAGDRQAIQSEINALSREIDSTTQRTQFNGMNLLDGTFTSKNLQIGANAGQEMGINIRKMNADGLGLTAMTAHVEGATTALGAVTLTGDVKEGTYTLSGAVATNAAVTDADGNTVGHLSVDKLTVNFNDGTSARLTTASTANTDKFTVSRSNFIATNVAGGTVTSFSGSAVAGGYTVGTGTNAGKLFSGSGVITDPTATGFDASKLVEAGTVNATSKSITFNATFGGGTATFTNAPTGDVTIAKADANAVSVNVSTRTAAQDSIKSIDIAIGNLSSQRADLGALQNRLSHTINNLGVSAENLAASESRIRDTDMAKEMTNFTRSQILQQAGVSMLAQANQSSQSVLKLLG